MNLKAINNIFSEFVKQFKHESDFQLLMQFLDLIVGMYNDGRIKTLYDFLNYQGSASCEEKEGQAEISVINPNPPEEVVEIETVQMDSPESQSSLNAESKDSEYETIQKEKIQQPFATQPDIQEIKTENDDFEPLLPSDFSIINRKTDQSIEDQSKQISSSTSIERRTARLSLRTVINKTVPFQIPTDHFNPYKRRSANSSNYVKNSKIPRPDVHQLCIVCEGEKATGFHYGVFTCEKCADTFKRRSDKYDNFVCSNDGKCDILKENRNSCIKCLISKCFQVGMKKDPLVRERYLSSIMKSTIAQPKVEIKKELLNCQVCDDQSVRDPNNKTCYNCNRFYKYYINKIGLNLECSFDNTCIFDKSIIKRCRACRYEKCIQVSIGQRLSPRESLTSTFSAI